MFRATRVHARPSRIGDGAISNGAAAATQNHPTALGGATIPFIPVAEGKKVAEVTRITVAEHVANAIQFDGTSDRLDAAHGDVVQAIDVDTPVPALDLHLTAGRVAAPSYAQGKYRCGWGKMPLPIRIQQIEQAVDKANARIALP